MGRKKLYIKNDHKREAELGNSKLPKENYRDPFRQDFARLTHCPSFRRLQGKTQLFPSDESDFFRNRLTHSLEVAQIAKSIAIRVNATEKAFKSQKINLDLVEFAGLAHDIGHPPFGHNGEQALDKLLIKSGGFEGNAQTLRILSRLEKKATTTFPHENDEPIPINSHAQEDCRLGLNLCHRSLAAILKYDNQIPRTLDKRTENDQHNQPVKGYYYCEDELVQRLKQSFEYDGEVGGFKTVECSIMDTADDIAYSTYDIEDSFKAGFLSPITMISQGVEFKKKIADKVRASIKRSYADATEQEQSFEASDIDNILANLFSEVFIPDENFKKRAEEPISIVEASFLLSVPVQSLSKEIGDNGYLRTALTSSLVGRFIRDIEVIPNDNLGLSIVRLKLSTFKIVETLKHYSYQMLIESPRLKLAERRGKEVIIKIFEELMNDSSILPDDWRNLISAIDDDDDWKKRCICDYIAGMTDRYCVEFYSRLTGSSPISFWKPH